MFYRNSPFLIIDHIHAKINRVCCAALAIGKKCMNVRKNKLLLFKTFDTAILLVRYLKKYNSQNLISLKIKISRLSGEKII